MIKKYFKIFILISAIAVFGMVAKAQEETEGQDSLADVQFPIVELGNCQSWGDCEVYCDKTENTDACLAFAEDQNLMSEEELAVAKKFKDIGMKGPGGCEGKDECEKYCDNKDNMETCVSFAEEKGLMSGEQLQESKKVLAAVKSGAKPLGCNGRQECDDYCASSEHMEECLNFGVEAGILPVQEQENARKVLTAIKNGAVRPACRGHECEVYCREGSEHAAECGSFAMAAGILSPPKMRQIQKILTAIEEGIELPSCSGEEECRDYCSQGANLEECVKFAEATGIMTSEEVAAARKTGGEGPNGCKTKEECDAFCDNPDNSEACFNFAKDNGLISEDDQKKIQNSQQQIKESFNNMPAEALDCLTSSLGVDTIEKLKSGNAMPGRKMAEKMEACLGKPGEQPSQPEQPEQPGQPGQNQGGAGPGNGAGQGNGGPNQGQGFNPGSGQKGGGRGQSANPNPVKCIEDCELVGRNCISALDAETKVCISKGEYCRTVTCETVDAEGNRSTAEVMRQCYASKCDPLETSCHDAVTAKDSACRTTKDVCVMNCQKASKPTEPNPPTQPTQPTQPSQPGQPGQQPTPSSQPTTGKCGDGKCGRAERADPTLCPQDCGGSSQPSQPEEPGQEPTPPSPPSPPSQPGQPGQQPTPPSPPSPPSQPN